jgi:FixJ family two-component response regulator
MNIITASVRAQPTVFLLDDDPSILNALGRGLRAAGFNVLTWNNVRDFLDQHDPGAPGCLVLDVLMPGINGLDLQKTLASRGSERYIVFISGVGDISTSVRAMRAGAVSFLTKPVHLDELAAAVREAIEKDAAARESRRVRQSIEARLQLLTDREREVLQHVLRGKMNKQIAASLGIAEKTIKIHRGRLMEKMRVKSVAQLVTDTIMVIAPPLARPPTNEPHSQRTGV